MGLRIYKCLWLIQLFDRSGCAHYRRNLKKKINVAIILLLCNACFISVTMLYVKKKKCYDVLNRNAPKSFVLPVQVLCSLGSYCMKLSTFFFSCIFYTKCTYVCEPSLKETRYVLG